MMFRIVSIICLSVLTLTSFSQKEKKIVRVSAGTTLSYVEAGMHGKDVVILLHGFTDTGRSFYPTIDSMQQLMPSLHIIAPDLRGHGDSSMPDAVRCKAAPEKCFAFGDLAFDIIELMDHKGIRQAHIVGHSLGSAIAQEIALSYPDRTKSLILIGSFARGIENPVINDFLRASTIEGAWKKSLTGRKNFLWPDDAYLLTPMDADSDALTWMAQNWVADPVADQKFVKQIVPETASIRLGTWIGLIRNLAVFDNTERLAQLRIPSMVIWGTQDNAFPESDQAELRNALDRAVEAGLTTYYYKVYGKQPLPVSGMQENDIGHNTQWSVPGAVAADIASFILTGEPTTRLPYADSVGKIVYDNGMARIMTGPRAAGN